MAVQIPNVNEQFIQRFTLVVRELLNNVIFALPNRPHVSFTNYVNTFLGNTFTLLNDFDITIRTTINYKDIAANVVQIATRIRFIPNNLPPLINGLPPHNILLHLIKYLTNYHFYATSLLHQCLSSYNAEIEMILINNQLLLFTVANEKIFASDVFVTAREMRNITTSLITKTQNFLNNAFDVNDADQRGSYFYDNGAIVLRDQTRNNHLIDSLSEILNDGTCTLLIQSHYAIRFNARSVFLRELNTRTVPVNVIVQRIVNRVARENRVVFNRQFGNRVHLANVATWMNCV